MGFIRGTSQDQLCMLTTFADRLPDDSIAPLIAAVTNAMDLAALGFTATTPKVKGRPAYEAKMLIRLYIYGMCHRMRSTRTLEHACRVNLEVIYLLDGLTPDHNTINSFRKDNKQALVALARDFSRRLRELELMGGELVAIDGTKLRACNNYNKFLDVRWLQREEVKVQERMEEYMKLLEEDETQEREFVLAQEQRESLLAEVSELQKQLGQLRQDLARCEENRQALGVKDRKRMPTNDPEAGFMVGGYPRQYKVGYNVQLAVDSKYGFVVTLDVVPHVNDFQQLAPMTKKVLDILWTKRGAAGTAAATAAHGEIAGSEAEPETPAPAVPGPAAPESATAAGDGAPGQPLKIVADAGYSSCAQVAQCEAMGVEVYVPCHTNNTGRTNKGETVFTKADFKYVPERDIFICPAGHEMHPCHSHDRGRPMARYFGRGCSHCPLHAQCTTTHIRGITRHPDETTLQRMRERQGDTAQYLRARSGLIERVFGTFRLGGRERCYLRGLEGVKAEMSLEVFAYNLKRAVKVLGAVSLRTAFESA